MTKAQPWLSMDIVEAMNFWRKYDRLQTKVPVVGVKGPWIGMKGRVMLININTRRMTVEWEDNSRDHFHIKTALLALDHSFLT